MILRIESSFRSLWNSTSQFKQNTTHVMRQWAAVSTKCSLSSAPPQKNMPSRAIATCHGNSPISVSPPDMMRRLGCLCNPWWNCCRCFFVAPKENDSTISGDWKVRNCLVYATTLLGRLYIAYNYSQLILFLFIYPYIFKLYLSSDESYFFFQPEVSHSTHITFSFIDNIFMNVNQDQEMYAYSIFSTKFLLLGLM